jgi:hypothetical protein
MKTKKLILFSIVLISLLSGSKLTAQDVHFSQIQESPLWLNPANAGFMNGYLRAIANYRNQWAATLQRLWVFSSLYPNRKIHRRSSRPGQLHYHRFTL